MSLGSLGLVGVEGVGVEGVDVEGVDVERVNADKVDDRGLIDAEGARYSDWKR